MNQDKKEIGGYKEIQYKHVTEWTFWSLFVKQLNYYLELDNKYTGRICVRVLRLHDNQQQWWHFVVNLRAEFQLRWNALY